MGVVSNSNDQTSENEDSSETAQSLQYPAHLWNPDIEGSWRYGLIVLWVATLGLLLSSDVGSGVKAMTQTVADESLGLTNFKSEPQVLLEASVFTSVAELWKAGSRPLSIFVAVSSITWPYVKLLLTLYAWVTPVRRAQRRERLLVALDLLGKWSLADVVVFSVIVVVFREQIPVGAGVLEVWIRPQWGLYGFIVASMFSLMTTHLVLFHHRRIIYKHVIEPNDVSNPPKTLAARMSTVARMLLISLLLAALAMYLVGSLTDFFRVTNSQSGIIRAIKPYSLAAIGQDLPDAKRDYEPAGGLIFLQIVWFFLGIVLPLAVPLALLVLLFLPLNVLRQGLLVAEIIMAWSCGEVVLISTVLAIREIPTFGDGLIDTGCAQCYIVDTKFTSEVSLLAVGTACTLGAAIYILKIAHGVAYPRHQTHAIERRRLEEAGGALSGEE